MPPRQYEGGGTSTFESLVGGVLGGYTRAQDYKSKKKAEAIADEDRVKRSRAERINEAIALDEGGYSVSDRPAASPSVAGAGAAPAAERAPAGVSLPPGVTPFNPRARIGPQLEDEQQLPASSTPHPAAAPVADGQPAPIATPEQQRGAAPAMTPRRNLLQRVGSALGAAVHTARDNITTGGYHGTPESDVTVTRTGPSKAERIATIGAQGRLEAVNAREANDVEIARIRAGAQMGVANIRARIAGIRAAGGGAGSGSAELNKVLIEINREVSGSQSRIRTLMTDPALKLENPDNPATVANANRVRAQIQAEQDAIADLETERRGLRSQFNVAGQTPLADPKRAAAEKRAKELYQHVNTSPLYGKLTDAERRAKVRDQLRREGFDVQ